MTSKFSELVSYFESIARQHIQIRHSENEKHFFRYEVEEVLSGINDINYPALIMEGYKFGFEDQKSDNPLKTKSGAFMLLDHVPDIGDYDRIHSVWDTMEEIGDDILARIRHDKRIAGSPVRDFDLESVEGQLIATELGNHYGIRFTFTVKCSFAHSMDPSKWSL